MTPELLRSAVGCTQALADVYAPPLTEAIERYGISTPARLTMFLAQVGHESGAFRYVRELWGPTPAQLRYEGRRDLGNVQPGDGRRYCGRGLIQTTGRANYVALRDRLRRWMPDAPDFEAHPELLEQPWWAALSAADYWNWRGLNALADAGDFLAVTRRINGGTNGLADRQQRWDRAKAAMTAHVPASAPIPAAPTPTPPTPIPASPAPSWRDQAPPVFSSQEGDMPIPAFVGAALPLIVQAIPMLGKLFGSGSDVAERNVRAAEVAVNIVTEAVQAQNAQEAVERIKSDPAAAARAAAAIEARWYELTEAGGGGIEGARKADAAAMASGGPVWRSPSFLAMLVFSPLAYFIVGSLVFDATSWSNDVRASLASAVISLVIGAATGYYFGSTTKVNTPGAK